MPMDTGELEMWDVENFANSYRNWLISWMDAWDYTLLFDILYETEFTWLLARDADRAEDGKGLRLRFAEHAGLELPPGSMEWPCSFLEMCVALAGSIEEHITYDPEVGDQTPSWFWEMMANVHLDAMDDDYMFEMGAAASMAVADICDEVMERTYAPDGRGGLFPLDVCSEDQRGVELWYQANAYILSKM